MTEGELGVLLRSLGIDRRSWGVLATLPLVEVAWADGEVQTEERRRILDVAAMYDVLSGDGRIVLEGWLRFPPSASYLDRAHTALQALVADGGLRQAGLDRQTLLQHSHEVARASGGFLGLIGRVEEEERMTLEALRTLLAEAASAPAPAPAPPSAPQVTLPEYDDADEITETLGTQPTPMGSGSHEAPADIPTLAVLAGLPPASVPLLNPTSVGRQDSCTLRAPDDRAMSRRHCHIYRRSGRWYVVDLGSQNGTFVNGERILERRLFGGEHILAGQVELQISLGLECT